MTGSALQNCVFSQRWRDSPGSGCAASSTRWARLRRARTARAPDAFCGCPGGRYPGKSPVASLARFRDPSVCLPDYQLLLSPGIVNA